MASLTEVYEGGAGGADLRRLYLGVGLFAVGAILTVSGIIVGTSTGVAEVLGLGTFEARELAGVLAGVGLPGTFLGAMTVLPKASWRIRAVAVLGSAVSLVGVLFFTSVYPQAWLNSPNMFTTVAVYFVGAITAFWALFVAVANFKARNDPGGTVRLEVTKEGETKVVEVSNDRLQQGLGGIGLFGSTPDGEVETQTNAPNSPRSDGGSTAADGGRGFDSGGATTSPTSTSDAEVLTDADPGPQGDVYCGNCRHFNYARTEDGLRPYCGLHEETMDDMDACRQWER